MRRVAIFFTLLAASSCTLLVSTSDLREGSGSTPSPPEGGPGFPDGNVVALGDGGGGGVDAAIDSSGALSGCKRFVPAPYFCSDFDTDPNVTAGFPTKTLDNGAAIDFSNTQFFSSPRSAHFTMKAPAEGALKRTFTPLGATLHFELRIRFEKIGTNGSAQVMRIAQTVGTEFRALILYVSASRTVFQEDPPTVQYNVEPDFTTQRWYHVAIDLTAGPASTFTATIDDQVVIQSQSLRPRDPTGEVEIGAGGIYFFQSTTDWDLTVDDVMVDRK